MNISLAQDVINSNNKLMNFQNLRVVLSFYLRHLNYENKRIVDRFHQFPRTKSDIFNSNEINKN